MFPRFISNVILNSPLLEQFLPYFAVIIILMSFLTNLSFTLQGLQYVKLNTVIGQFVKLPIKIVISFVLISLGLGLEGFIIAELLGISIAILISLYYLIKVLPYDFKNLFTKRVNNFSNKEKSFAQNMLIINIMGPLSAQADKILLAYYFSAAEIGINAVIITIISFVPIFLISVNSIFSPIISELVTKNNFQDLNTYFQKAATYIFALSYPLIFFLIIFKNELLNVFGYEFISGKTMLTLCLISELFNVGTGPSGIMLTMSGFDRISKNLNIFSSVVALICYVVFIPRFGLTGVGISRIIHVGILNILNLIYCYKKIKVIPYSRLFYYHLLIYSTISILLYSLKEFLPIFGKYSFLIYLPFYFILFILTSFIMTPKNDRNHIIKIFKGII